MIPVLFIGNSEVQLQYYLEALSKMDGGCSDVVSNTSVVVIPADCDNLILSLLLTIIMQMTFYMIACTCKFDKVTDFAGGSNFVLLAVVSFALSGVSYNNVNIGDTFIPPPPEFPYRITMYAKSSLPCWSYYGG